jgi:hypothetical protein
MLTAEDFKLIRDCERKQITQTAFDMAFLQAHDVGQIYTTVAA